MKRTSTLLVAVAASFILSFISLKVSAQTIQLGFDSLVTSTCDPSPVGIYYKSTHMQIVYRKAELNAAGVYGGRITGLGFDIVSLPNYNLPNYTIKLKHDTINTVTSPVLGSFQTVYYETLYAPDTAGYDMFTLDSAFYWNGSDNIVVDVCWDRVPSYSCSGSVRYYVDSNFIAGYAWQDNNDMCAYPISSTAYKPHIKFVFQPLQPNDAGIIGSNIGDIVCAGSNIIKATVNNFGTSIIDSVMIGWKINGVSQTPVKVTTALDSVSGSGTSYAEVTLGNYTFTAGTIYKLKMYSYLPNNTTDPFAPNDTIVKYTRVGLDGTYTIGGVSPNYATVSAALAAIDSLGICDTVILSIRSGTYNEQLQMPNYLSSSSSNYVIIQSESGDSSTVIINSTSLSTYSNNYTVNFIGSKRYIFKDITLKSANTSYGVVVAINQNASNLSFKNCVIEGYATTYNSSYHNLVYSDDYSFSNNLKFWNTKFVNGSAGLYLEMSYNSSNQNTGLEVSKCTFVNQYYVAADLSSFSGMVFSGNKITSNSSASSFYGVGLSDLVNTATITNNTITGINNGYGFNINYGTFASATPALIANNYVSILGTANYSSGMQLYSCQNFNLLYNSINLSATTNTTSRALELSYCSNFVAKNNILYANAGYAYYVQSPSNHTCDNNNIFANGSQFAYWNAAVADLAALRAFSGQDSNSVSVQPFFVSTSSFKTAQIMHNGTATPVAEVTTDIEGDLRHATTPDIGVDEFVPVGVDASILALIVPEAPFAPGTYPIKAVLQNQGAATITSATINWIKNGTAQTPFAFTGSLLSGATDTVTLGTTAFAAETLHDFVVYSSNPNGTPDVQPINDTLGLLDIAPALGGIYTLGGTSPDFLNFSELAYWLNIGGVYDSVTVNVRNGTYSEQVIINHIAGSDSANTVLIQAENGDSSLVILTSTSLGSGNNYLVNLNGADWLTWKQITFFSNHYYYQRNIDFNQGSSQNTFLNCVFSGQVYSNTGTNAALVYNETGGCNNNLFNNCLFSNGSYGFYFYGYSSSGYETNNAVTNSTFSNQYYRAAYIYYERNFVFDNNYITTNYAYSSEYRAGYFTSCDGNLRVTKNRIANITASTPYGFYLNNIYSTSPDTALVANNMITLGGTSGNYGIYAYNCNNLIIANNSVLINSTNTNSKAFFDEGYNYNSYAYNNIFENTGGGYAVYNSNYWNATFSDFNNLRTNGTNLGYYNGLNVSTLAAWQAATGRDSNSFSVDPQFIDPQNLHITAVALNSSGTPIPMVVDDIDGETRNPLAPDIGADEFMPIANDAGVASINYPAMPFPSGFQNIYVTLLNNGIDTLTNVNISWAVNGIYQTTYAWTGALPSGQTMDSVLMGTYNFINYTPHQITVWTSLPNGMIDGEPNNDTASLGNLYPALAGLYTIGGVNPDFATFTEAVTALNTGGIVDWVNFKVRDGIYTEQLTLNNIAGASASDSIRFYSETENAENVTLTFNANSTNVHTVLLNGTKHISFKNITFRAENYFYASIFILQNNTYQTAFRNCVFVGQAGTSYSSSRGIYLSQTGINEYLTVTNCTFINGYAGVYATGNYNNGKHIKGLKIKNSTFNNQTYYGIYAYRMNRALITQNSLTRSNYTGTYTMYISDCDSAFTITKNQIYTPYYGTGVYISNTNASATERGLFANNFIAGQDSAASSYYPLLMQYSDNIDIVYNNLHSASGSTSSRALYLYYGSGNRVVNNNFVNSGAGHAFYIYPNYAISTIDYNNYFVAGTTLGNFNGTNITDLAAMRLATGQDSNSISNDPNYTTVRNLHVASSAIDSAATPFAGVLDDIDGETRNLTNPDIGADEVLYFPDDLAVSKIISPVSACGLGNSDTLTVRVQNLGSDPQTGFAITVKLGSDVFTQNVGALSINGGSYADVKILKGYDLSLLTGYNFKIWVSLAVDANRNNDTLRKSIVHYPPVVAKVTNDTTICAGTVLQLRAQGGSYYTWSNGSTSAITYVTPTVTTKYKVTIKSINNCLAYDSVLVTVVNPGISTSLIVAGSTTICNGDSVLLYSTNPSGILWSNGSQNDSIYAKTQGIYRLSFNSPGSVCNNVQLGATTITVLQDSIKVIGLRSICAGDSVTLQATNYTSGTWSNGVSQAIIKVSPPSSTTYYITFTGQGGCLVTDSVYIQVLPAVPPAMPGNLYPLNGTLNLVPPIQFSWAPAANAVVYDVYVWRSDQFRSPSPSINGTSSISSSYHGNLVPGQIYYWQVASRNSCFTTFSDTLSFTSRSLPDLVVDTLIIPASALSGSQVTITYTVKNIGGYTTGSTTWHDYVWLSTDEDLRIGDDIQLAQVNNLTYLDTGQSYTNTVTVQLPPNILSNVLLFVITDNIDSYCATAGWTCYPGAPRGSHGYGMNELNQQNNYQYDTLYITPSPLPDLKLETVGAPTAAFSGADITVTYAVKNNGQADATTAQWQNCFYYSTDSIYGPTTATQLYPKNYNDRYQQGTLYKDSSELKTATFALPISVFGDYWFFVNCDCLDNVFEGAYEFNNFGSTAVPTQITLSPPPDLVVDSIYVPATAVSGTTASIAYRVLNQGANAPVVSGWRDTIWVSTSSTFDRTQASYVSYRTYYNGFTLTSGSSYVQNVAFTMPAGITGNYYVYIKTDASRDVFEYTFENNNIGRSPQSINVSLAPYADLVVKRFSVSATDTVFADSIIQVNWTIHNQGTGPMTTQFADRVYFSQNPMWNANGNSVAINNTYYYTQIPAGDSIQRSASFIAPNVTLGTYYFYVQTDQVNQVYEYQFENNNITGGAAVDADGIIFKPRPASSGGGTGGTGGPGTPIVYSDLELISLTAPAALNSGQLFTASWSVKNNGGSTTAINQWVDKIYFSADTVLNAGDVELSQKYFASTLAVNATYQSSANATIPQGASGTYYLLMITDAGNLLTGDTIKANNLFYKPLTVALSPPPDLQITSLTIPAGQVYGGQQLQILYAVKNFGTGAVTGINYNDVVYMNNLPTPNGGVAIGTRTKTRTVAAGATYIDTVLVTIPAYASGNYYMAIRTDANNQVYEHAQENNNDSAGFKFINPGSQLNTDLIITTLAVPDTMLMGKQYTINYSVKNQGSTNAVGSKSDAFFHSANTTYNGAVDKLFKTETDYISMAPGAAAAYQIDGRMGGVDAGNYYGILRVNTTATIPETDLTNNDSVTATPIVVDADALTLNVNDTSLLNLNKPVFYKITVSAGKDLLITLTSNQVATGLNEVYVAYNRVPTSSNYDFKHTLSSSLNQTALVPNTLAGTYFVYINTQNQYATAQTITTLAQELPYQILNISPSTVGQGIVSTSVNGAGFRPGIQFFLKSGTTYLDTAVLKTYVSSMQVELEWNFTNTPIGTYTLESKNTDNTVAFLANAITVETTTGYAVNSYALAPSLLRTGKTAFFSFVFENVGNVDVPFVKADVSFPDYAILDQINVAGGDVFTIQDMNFGVGPVDDWILREGNRIVPLVAKYLKPQEQFTLNITIRNFPYAQFPYQLQSNGFSEEEFIQYQLSISQIYRQAMLMNQDSISSPDVINWLLDPVAYRDTIIARYIQSGLLTAQDTAGVDFNCSGCPNYYDISPGLSPGLAQYNNLTLNGGQSMLWEINHPTGTAGADPGWDLVYSVGSINVAATSVNPFTIDLLSLSSYDNSAAFLTSWESWRQQRWPIMIADAGITGFNANKFSIDVSRFTTYNATHGGTFSLSISSTNDTIYLNFSPTVPGFGQPGYSGGNGHIGQAGGHGGPGGAGDGTNPPGPGGSGGNGGEGDGTLPPGPGGNGGQGGTGASGQNGGPGGSAGSGGSGGSGQNGGPGGNGGSGGSGGTGGNGGSGGAGGSGGSGGDGGSGGSGGNGGSGGSGGSGGGDGGNGGNGGSGGDGGSGGTGGSGGGSGSGGSGGSGGGSAGGSGSGGSGGGNGGPGGGGPGGGGPGGAAPCGSPQTSNRTFCDNFNDFNRALGCEATAIGCVEDGIKFTALGAVAGAGFGAIAGAVFAGLKCGIGIYNCATGGNDLTNAFGCGAAAIDLATGDVFGGSVGASGCAGWIFCDDKPVVSSCDPNEIVGPTGYGVDRFIAKKDEMKYTIYFENDSAFATTAAQRVTVRLQIHPNMNALSLKLEEVGFGKYVFQIPNNPPNYTTTLLLQDSADIGVDVQFTAGVDIVKNELFFIFQSIDRGTGVAPYDPLAGFLKVNDSTGSGEGFVKYSIKPSSATVTGDSITAEASIVFDINSTIKTNKEFNIIDAVAPTSTLDPLPATVDSTNFWISWNGVDDAGGSGVGSYALYASENYGAFVQAALLGPDTAYKFSGNNLSRYDFYIQAIDFVGNKEALKNVAEIHTVINASDLRFVSPVDSMLYCAGDTVELFWNPGGINLVNLAYSSDSGTTYTPIISAIDSLSVPYKWQVPLNVVSGNYVFRVSDTADIFYSFSDSIGIGAYPEIVLTANTPICQNDTLQLTAQGGKFYRWTPATGLSSATVAAPKAYPDSTTTYTVVVSNEFGCESQAAVTVTVNYPDTVHTFANTCDSALAGTFYTNLANKNSCDSLVIHQVSFKPSFETPISGVAVCQGDSVQLFGKYQKLPGTYRDTLFTQFGCDSVIVQTLQVNPVFDLNDPVISICAGDSVYYAGAYRKTAGFFTDSLQTDSGCDSLRTVEVKVNPIFAISETAFICQGDSILLGGFFQKTAGNYIDNLQTMFGCDSIVTTALTVGNVPLTAETATICSGDSILLGGDYQTTAGSYVDILVAANTCDSVITTTLTVLPNALSSEVESICQGDSILLGGDYRTTAGTYIDVFAAANGCDSVVSTTLNILPNKTTSETASICQGDSIFLGGDYRITAGSYLDYFAAANGCDSTLTTVLTVIPKQYTTAATSICQGDSVFIAGDYRTTSGSYPQTYAAQSSCDSIHTIALTVLPNKTGTDAASICAGDSIFLAGDYRTTAGNYVDVLSAANGCDSVLSTTLSVLPNKTGTKAESICQGDSIYLGGAYRTNAGTYIDVLNAANGCDSVLSTSLSVLPNKMSTDAASICQGDSILLGGLYRTTAGLYVDVFVAANGCDSTVTTTLTVTPAYTANASASICQGDSIFLAGNYQTTAGTYVDAYQGANGCDSTISTLLTVKQHVVATANASICQGDSILLGGAYRTAAGVYASVFTAANGCDSTLSTTLSVTPTVTGTRALSICNGDSVLLGGAYQTTSGSYVDVLTSAAGCDSVLTTTLSVFTVNVAVTMANNVITASANSATYRWIDCATNLYIFGETGKTFTPTANGLYAVEVTQSGCVDTSVCVAITTIGLGELEIPNLSYKPNPTSGIVYVELGKVYQKVTVMVVSTAGQLLANYAFENVERLEVDLSEEASAEYFLQIKADDKQQIIKVVKRQ